MIQVTRASFFATVGQMNVHPHIGQQAYDNAHGYTSTWQTPARQVVGKSDGGTHLLASRFFVTEDFYEKHKTSLTKEPA
jgi:hypothetical protein